MLRDIDLVKTQNVKNKEVQSQVVTSQSHSKGPLRSNPVPGKKHETVGGEEGYD